MAAEPASRASRDAGRCRAADARAEASLRWSFDDLEREVRANLVYRAFTRIDAGEVPDAKTILKIARVLGPDAIQQLHQRIVDVAKRVGERQEAKIGLTRFA